MVVLVVVGVVALDVVVLDVVVVDVVVLVEEDVETVEVEELDDVVDAVDDVVDSSILTQFGLSFIFPFLHFSIFIGLSSSKPG